MHLTASFILFSFICSDKLILIVNTLLNIYSGIHYRCYIFNIDNKLRNKKIREKYLVFIAVQFKFSISQDVIIPST